MMPDLFPLKTNHLSVNTVNLDFNPELHVPGRFRELTGIITQKSQRGDVLCPNRASFKPKDTTGS